ncbi:hypothetical protein V6N13_031485 [Hibiscus sabdariffa]|uniref:Uncharacterized protein n=2 Tax=Hibiscus sabdariffa TaxID=183260 RepID=A0ABR2CK73_9ROSI
MDFGGRVRGTNERKRPSGPGLGAAGTNTVTSGYWRILESLRLELDAGVPLVTWPLFADQFANEKLAVEILKIGVRVEVEEPVRWGEEEKIGVLVKKEDVKEAIEKLMDEGEEGEERRIRTKKLGEMAKKSVEIGGIFSP